MSLLTKTFSLDFAMETRDLKTTHKSSKVLSPSSVNFLETIAVVSQHVLMVFVGDRLAVQPVFSVSCLRSTLLHHRASSLPSYWRMSGQTTPLSIILCSQVFPRLYDYSDLKLLLPEIGARDSWCLS